MYLAIKRVFDIKISKNSNKKKMKYLRNKYINIYLF